MNIRIFAAVLALAVLPLSTASPALAIISGTDRDFARTAAAAGMAEVADGRLALAHTHNAAVRAVARRMIRDHSAANARLARIAGAEGIALPPGPDAADRAMMARQRTLTGMAFDMRYLRDQSAAHVQAIALFRHEIAAGSDRRIVGFARATLPTLQMHLRMVRSALTRM